MKTLLPLAVALLPLPAFATCSEHDALQARLASGWGESRQSIGLAGNGTVLETFANPDTGTWTIAVTRPGGPTCIVAAGEHWEALEEPLPPGGEGA